MGLLPPIQPPTLSILTAVGRRTVAPDYTVLYHVPHMEH